MNKILFISTILFILIAFETFAQTGDAEQERSKMKEQKPKKRKREEALTQYTELARTRKWAIVISQVNVGTRDLIDVDPKLNFITIKDEDITTQLDFDYNYRRGASLGNREESIVFGNIEDYDVKQSNNNVIINVRYKNTAGGGEHRRQIVISSSGWARTDLGSPTTFGKFIPLDQAYIHLMGVKIR